MVTVGIDPHKHVHVAVVVDAGGRRLGKPLTVGNDASLIAALIKWIRSITGDTPVTWAIEDGRGFARRLADGLLLAGHEVVWVPTRLAAAHRKLHAATGAKSDQIDAAAVATPPSPPQAWTGTASTRVCASCVSWSTTGPTSSNAAQWRSISSKPSSTCGSTTPPATWPAPGAWHR